MRTPNRLGIALVGAVASLAASTSAQTIVTGTGDPNVDVPAVQMAVDQGGHVVLKGRFSFDRPPTAPPGALYTRMVTVSKSTRISGAPDDQGELPTIAAGTWPFFVDAASATVTIERLHFVGPQGGAIWVYAVGGLLIAGCHIEHPAATVEFGLQAGIAAPITGGIFLGADPHPPSGNFPGKPGNFSGRLAFVNNVIDMGAKPDGLRLIGGRVLAERNTILTGTVTGGAQNPDAFRIVGSGSYLIAHNSIDCGWPEPTATVINVFGQSINQPPVTGAIVVDNDVTMSAPDGTAFASNSAAIGIGGRAEGSLVLNNSIHGRARAALSVLTRNNVQPARNAFVGNDVQDFQPSLANIFVDTGVTSTVIVGRPTSLEDRGIGTVVVPTP